MGKLFFIDQPPLTRRYRLLVDSTSKNKKYGLTTDIDKIRYNTNLLGLEFNLNLKLNLLSTDEGSTVVFPIGTFITVLQLRKDENEGIMSFFDFNIKINDSNFILELEKMYSKNIVDKWLSVYKTLHSDFSEDEDVVDLFIPEL